MRILIVEDHPDTAAVLARFLRYAGHDVVTTDRADRAYLLCQGGTFDAMVCDICLPDENGWQFMARLARVCDLPAVAISGWSDEADVRRSLDAGFAAHLAKPVDFDAMRAIVERLGHGRRARTERSAAADDGGRARSCDAVDPLIPPPAADCPTPSAPAGVSLNGQLRQYPTPRPDDGM